MVQIGDLLRISRENLIKAVAAGSPLLILPLVNLMQGYSAGSLSVKSLSGAAVLRIIFFVFIEELIFRGILLMLLKRKFSLRHSCAISSAVFAALHFANYLSGTALPETLLQIIFAFGAGYSLSALSVICDSILPGILIHFLLNISAEISGIGALSGSVSGSLLWGGLSAACLFYGIILLRKA